MVSTRRMESGGTGHHSGIPHRTRVCVAFVFLATPTIVDKFSLTN